MRRGERAIEQAEQRAAQEREAGIRFARSVVEQAGTAICEDCGVEISRARRAAAPFATRCIDCQTAAERRRWQYRDL